MDKTILYIGLDDSNHSPDTNKRAEIVVATFSFLYRDSIRKRWINRKRYDEAQNWMKNPERDYRFLTLDDTMFAHTKYNLCLAAPFLIDNFRLNCPRKIDGIKVYLDGLQVSKHKKVLRQELRQEFPDAVVDSFQKQQNVPDCPKVVDIADIYATMIFRDSAGCFLNNPKRVIVPNEELLKRALKFSAA